MGRPDSAVPLAPCPRPTPPARSPSRSHPRLTHPAPNAQWEIQEFARVMAGMLKGLGLSPLEIQELREKLVPRPIPDFELDLSRMRTPEEVEKEMYRAVPGGFE